jgi:protein-S-isoprenylcysteine O-methyltransferase Ste14
MGEVLAQMKNGRKWFIVIPSVLLIGLGIPALIAGELLWFTQSWSDSLFVVFGLATWITAAAFVIPERSGRSFSLSRFLLTVGLVLVIPVAVLDRSYGPAMYRSTVWSSVGLVVCCVAMPLGISARRTLGRYYVPDPEILPGQLLTTHGPYNFVRHPLYMAAFLWSAGLSLLLRSLWGIAVLVVIFLPAVVIRIREEEAMLTEEFGEEYRGYASRTWKLLPYLY